MKKTIQILTIFSFVNIINNLIGIYYGYFGDNRKLDISILWGYSLFTNLLFAIFFVYFAITTMEGTLWKKIKFLLNELAFGILIVFAISIASKYI
jgi:hypothetical protein